MNGSPSVGKSEIVRHLLNERGVDGRHTDEGLTLETSAEEFFTVFNIPRVLAGRF